VAKEEKMPEPFVAFQVAKTIVLLGVAILDYLAKDGDLQIEKVKAWWQHES